MVGQLQDLLPLISTTAIEQNLESLYLSLMRLTHHLQTHFNVVLLLAYTFRCQRFFNTIPHQNFVRNLVSWLGSTLSSYRSAQDTLETAPPCTVHKFIYAHYTIIKSLSFFFYFPEHLILKCLCFTKLLLIERFLR